MNIRPASKSDEIDAWRAKLPFEFVPDDLRLKRGTKTRADLIFALFLSQHAAQRMRLTYV